MHMDNFLGSYIFLQKRNARSGVNGVHGDHVVKRVVVECKSVQEYASTSINQLQRANLQNRRKQNPNRSQKNPNPKLQKLQRVLRVQNLNLKPRNLRLRRVPKPNPKQSILKLQRIMKVQNLNPNPLNQRKPQNHRSQNQNQRAVTSLSQAAKHMNFVWIAICCMKTTTGHVDKLHAKVGKCNEVLIELTV